MTTAAIRPHNPRTAAQRRPGSIPHRGHVAGPRSGSRRARAGRTPLGGQWIRAEALVDPHVLPGVPRMRGIDPLGAPEEMAGPLHGRLEAKCADVEVCQPFLAAFFAQPIATLPNPQTAAPAFTPL